MVQTQRSVKMANHPNNGFNCLFSEKSSHDSHYKPVVFVDITVLDYSSNMDFIIVDSFPCTIWWGPMVECAVKFSVTTPDFEH